MAGEPAAFMSYVRFNDEHDDGQITRFRERLSSEVRAQTGEEFAIFQDRADITWGQNWQQRINETLDGATLLLVIITPSLFRSTACRKEVNRFLEREHALGRQDLILPVYYINAREMDDPALQSADEMARVLTSRQYADWRELRFKQFNSMRVRKAIEQLASQMRDALLRPSASPERPAQRARAAKSPARSANLVSDTGQATAKTEPSTLVVDADQRGNSGTLGEAIRAAKPGDRIVVRPGLYDQDLAVDKTLAIPVVGKAGAGEPILTAGVDVEALLVPLESARRHDVFAVKVRGDSMTADNVLDGDYVIVDGNQEVRNRDMVVVRFGGPDDSEAVVGRLRMRQGELVLSTEPSNPDHPSVRLFGPDNPAVEGKVIGVFRPVK